jgi:hypothetical protein
MAVQDQSTQDFIAKIEHGLAPFVKGDEPSYSDEILIAFARHGVDFIEHLPKSRMSDPVLLAIAENTNSSHLHPLRYFNPEDTKIYRDLAILAVAGSCVNLNYVSEEFVDAQFIRDTVEKSPYSLTEFLTKYTSVVEQAYDTTAIEAILEANQQVRSNVIFGLLHGDFKTPWVTDNFIKRSLVPCPGLMIALLDTDKSHLGIEIVREGQWLDFYAKDKPADLKDAIKRMRKPMSLVAQSWQLAYAMTCDIAEVIKSLKHPRKIELLESIYSRDEILPHLSKRTDFEIKGKWLEDALGL